MNLILASLLTLGAAEAARQPSATVVKITNPQSKATELIIAIGPGNSLLPSGLYRFIRIPADGSPAVETRFDTSGGVVPTPTPEPTPVDFTASIKAALDKASDDKVKTAGLLKSYYDEFIKGAKSGSLTVGQLSSGVTVLTQTAITGKSTWVEFSTILSKEIAKAKTPSEAADTLQIAATMLGNVK